MEKYYALNEQVPPTNNTSPNAPPQQNPNAQNTQNWMGGYARVKDQTDLVNKLKKQNAPASEIKAAEDTLKVLNTEFEKQKRADLANVAKQQSGAIAQANPGMNATQTQNVTQQIANTMQNSQSNITSKPLPPSTPQTGVSDANKKMSPVELISLLQKELDDAKLRKAPQQEIFQRQKELENAKQTSKVR